MATGAQAVAKAKSQNGVAEIGYTNNVIFNTWFYGRVVSGAAYPWCAAFTSWVYSQLGMKAGVDYPHSAGVAVCFNWYISKGRKVSKYNLKPGDQVRYTFSHTGIFSHYNSAGTPVVWEGNTSGTNAGSQRDGGGVHLRTRAFSLVQYGGRPFFGATSTTTSTPSAPEPKKGILGMSISNAGFRSKVMALAKGKWKTIYVDDKGGTSLATVKKGDDIIASAEVSFKGLKPGAAVIGRFILVSYKKGTATRRILTYPSQEIIGTAGASHGKVIQLATVSRIAESGRSLRLRFEVFAGTTGVKLTNATFKLGKG